MLPTNQNRSYFFRPLVVLAGREIIRFYRQRSRIIGALVTPLIFWFLLGSGMGNSLQFGGDRQSYLLYFFPGSLALTLLFTSIFSNISVIEDRREGFMQAVLVAPLSRKAIVGGKILGGSLIAFFQGLIFLALAPLIGISLSLSGVLEILVVMASLSFALTCLGFFFAWKLDSVQGFHSIMNVLLFPMWFLSGALFPYEAAPLWLRVPMLLNPLTYGVERLRHALAQTGGTSLTLLPLANFGLPIVCVFGLILFLLSALMVGRRPGESHT